MVDEQLSFKSHIEYICTKARKSYGRLAAISCYLQQIMSQSISPS